MFTLRSIGLDLIGSKSDLIPVISFMPPRPTDLFVFENGNRSVITGPRYILARRTSNCERNRLADFATAVKAVAKVCSWTYVLD